MKWSISILLLMLLFSCFTSKAQAIITFKKTILHFGFIRQGDTLKFDYKFTNTGNEPLKIIDARVECGCTLVNMPTNLINLGKSGEINVVFNSTNAFDRQDRTITILSTAIDSLVVLRFKCVVLKHK